MTVDTFTLVVQLVLLAAIILAPWFYRRSRRSLTPEKFSKTAKGRDASESALLAQLAGVAREDVRSSSLDATPIFKTANPSRRYDALSF
jgi:hypothetical protein